MSPNSRKCSAKIFHVCQEIHVGIGLTRWDTKCQIHLDTAAPTIAQKSWCAALGSFFRRSFLSWTHNVYSGCRGCRRELGHHGKRNKTRFQDYTVSFFYASRVDPSPRRLEPRLGFLRRMQFCSWRPKLRAVVCQATWVDWALEPSCHQASSSCSASSGERRLVVCLYF